MKQALPSQVDFIIIGQGLAGSLLAWTLMQHNVKVLVIDNGHINASQVAAGIINPVTGMRLHKTSDSEILINTATTFYQQLQDKFKQTFFIERPLLRIIRNHKELQYCQKRLTDPDYQLFLHKFVQQHNDFNAPLGILQQQQTGNLHCKQLLQTLRDYLINQHSYLKTELDYQHISIKDEQISWQQVAARKIIFCEGYLAQNNPWFNSLPWQLVKGEILTLKSSNPLADAILNYGYWMLPVTDIVCKTGATFDREQINQDINTNSKQQLLKQLYDAYPGFKLAEILHHEAGIRPCTRDKQPFIGLHPKYPALAIFNGFGAKGSLQIPWHALQFARFLTNNTKLPDTTNITRYHASHFTG